MQTLASTELRSSKLEARSAARARRAEILCHERNQLSARIVQHALEWLEQAAPSGSTVAIYRATPHEADLDALIEHRARWRLVAPGEEGFACLGEEGLRAGASAGGATWPVATGEGVGADEIDIAFLPGLAFDKAGGRLGQGGGWYDRALCDSRAVRVGVGFEVQVLAGPLPRETHDLMMDFLLTERGLRATSSL
jgi:5-formyltetrahydrofolate cyclo-ligase